MLSRDDIIRMAQLAGFSPPVSADGYMGLAYDDNLQRFAAAAYAAGQAAERETRQAAQLETIALREELTKRAMQAEKDAYQRGVRDGIEQCAKFFEGIEGMDHPGFVVATKEHIACAIRSLKETQ